MNAKKYSEINDVQVQYGKNLATTAEIKRGDKVLDMGCGTGELTSFLAEKVGNQSQVVGVDPDVERINVAIQKHSGIHENVTFKHGESSSQFPHFDEQYYDIHFSNFVFQWLNSEEKEIYAQTAFKCLKPGGKIAIQTMEDVPDIVKEAKNLFPNDTEKLLPSTINAERVPVQYCIKKSETEELLQKSGFVIISSEYYQRSCTFPSVDDFLTFIFVSDYCDETKISACKKNDFTNKFVNDDGTATCFSPTIYQIVAKKVQ